MRTSKSIHKTKNNNENLVDIELRTIALLACFYLGGTKNKINTEDICVKIFDWVPERVSWAKPEYSTFPEKQQVIRRLVDLKKDMLIVGSLSRDIAIDGWTLTKAGLIVAQEKEHLIPKTKGTKIIESSLSKDDVKLLKSYLEKLKKYVFLMIRY